MEGLSEKYHEAHHLASLLAYSLCKFQTIQSFDAYSPENAIKAHWKAYYNICISGIILLCFKDLDFKDFPPLNTVSGYHDVIMPHHHNATLIKRPRSSVTMRTKP